MTTAIALGRFASGLYCFSQCNSNFQILWRPDAPSDLCRHHHVKSGHSTATVHQSPSWKRTSISKIVYHSASRILQDASQLCQICSRSASIRWVSNLLGETAQLCMNHLAADMFELRYQERPLRYEAYRVSGKHRACKGNQCSPFEARPQPCEMTRTCALRMSRAEY